MSMKIDDPYNLAGLEDKDLIALNKALLDKLSNGTLEQDGKEQLAAVKKEVSKRNL